MSGVDAGRIVQAVTGFVPGQEYHLSFFLAGNPEAGPLVKTLQASVGPFSQTYTFDGTGFTTTHLGWTQQMLDFTATSTSMELAFTSLNPGWSGPALDGVAITPVPEPGAVTLGLASLSLFFLVRRRGGIAQLIWEWTRRDSTVARDS